RPGGVEKLEGNADRISARHFTAHTDRLAVVNGLQKLRRHRAALQPFAPERLDYRSRQVSVVADAGDEPAREAIERGHLIAVNPVVRSRRVIPGSDVRGRQFRSGITRRLLTTGFTAMRWPRSM